jgi:phage shock protein A
MPWLERFACSLRSDAHAVVDARGQETTMLKDHVRSAEEAVQRKRAAFVDLAAEATRLTAERTRARVDCERFEGDVDLALNGGRKDLARHALRLLLRRRQVDANVERRLALVSRAQKDLEIVLARQQAALQELRARVQIYLSDWEADHFAAGGEPVTEEQIDLELLRRKAGPDPANVAGVTPVPQNAQGIPDLVPGDA